MQQPLCRLPLLFDILSQDACRIISGLNYQCIAFPMTDGMAQRTPRAIFRVGLRVHVNDPAHIHPLVVRLPPNMNDLSTVIIQEVER